jgi:hypothetical protein
MSHPPHSPDGSPDPDEPDDPWATPAGDAGQQPSGYGQPPYPPPSPPQSGQYPPQYPPQSSEQYPPQYSGQYPPQYSGQYPPQYSPPSTNGKAQAALWSGVALLVLGCCGLGVFGVVPVVLGVKARREIRDSHGQQEGDGMALAGIITGVLAILLSLLAIVTVVLIVAAGSTGFDTYTGTGV